MQQLIKKEAFRFSIDTGFRSVIRACKTSSRKDQQGTWITNEVEQAYCLLHEKGYAHSAEAWMGDELVGGLYGIRTGKAFFGESMFSHQSNASKFAFIRYVQLLQQEGIELIDCQVYTAHLESLGAEMIAREIFMKKLKQLLPAE